MKRQASKKKVTSVRGRGGALRVAVAGCGVLGREHVRNLLKLPDVDLVALSDSNIAACSRLRDEELVPQGRPCSVFHTLEEQLRLARLDAVVIATPHYLHYPEARAALEAGVHVLMERPMVTSTRHARQLISLARRRKRVLAISFKGTCTSELTYARDVIGRGDLGDILTVDGFVSQDWLKACRGTWRLRREQSGGGMLYDTGSHLLNAVLWLTGLKPVEVFAWIDNRGEEVDITAGVLVRFENGALATLMSNGDAQTFDSTIRIKGTRGVIVTSAYGGTLEHWEGGERLKYPPVQVSGTSPQSDFLGAIRGKTEPVCPPEWGLKLCRLMDAIYASAEAGKVVKVSSR